MAGSQTREIGNGTDLEDHIVTGEGQAIVTRTVVVDTRTGDPVPRFGRHHRVLSLTTSKSVPHPVNFLLVPLLLVASLVSLTRRPSTVRTRLSFQARTPPVLGRLRDQSREITQETGHHLHLLQNARELEVLLPAVILIALATLTNRDIAIQGAILTEASRIRSVVAASLVVGGPGEDLHDGVETGVNRKVDDDNLRLVLDDLSPPSVVASLITTLVGGFTALSPKKILRKGLVIDLCLAILLGPAIQGYLLLLAVTR
ncbi:hypothetical protein EYZ11_003641 [Aspergillus tanneri]|uniref:Uncharacterized protein n=1 Tax=Aspergillus tanneri TaxID=1220188 RepID=A0A4S3JTA5_9EURO|nr:hypothetical protein EYZ11_003641 [Aspergillus tanneri]